MTAYPCPVCGYPNLPDPPIDMSYEICPSCGTEFGYTDFRRSHDELMTAWLRTGPRWHAEWFPAPADWNGKRQLLEYRIPSASKTSGQQTLRGSRPALDVVQANTLFPATTSRRSAA